MVETICFTINYIKGMCNGLIQFGNATKPCKVKVFRVHGTYMLALLIIANFYLCSECATSIGFTCQLPGVHRAIEATWKDHGFGSSTWWTSFSWLPGTWVWFYFYLLNVFFSEEAYKHECVLCCLFSLLALQKFNIYGCFIIALSLALQATCYLQTWLCNVHILIYLLTSNSFP